MYSGGKYSKLSYLLSHFMLFGALPFVCQYFAAIFPPFWIVQGSSYIKEVLGYKKLDLSEISELSLSPSLLNSLLLIFNLANQSGVQVSLNQA